MRRRRFAQLAVGAASWPRAVRAQPGKIPTVGVLVIDSPGSEVFWRMFRDAMRGLGYEEGRTVRFEFRSDQGRAELLPELAADLVRLKVDVIVPWFTPAATAAKNATADIPIVMALAGDPIATGLVKSLSRPGGNVTGMAGGAPLVAKAMQFLGEALPSMRRLTVLANAPDPFSKPFRAQVREAGVAMGVTLDEVMIRNPADLDSVFVALGKSAPDGLIAQPSLPLGRIADLALSHRIPTASVVGGFAERGGLMSYWFAQRELYRRAAEIVDKVLKGAKPADLPVEKPYKLELTVNLRTAKALGLQLPRALLAQADEVIE